MEERKALMFNTLKIKVSVISIKKRCVLIHWSWMEASQGSHGRSKVNTNVMKHVFYQHPVIINY
jgi:hypothetical protein